MNELETVVVFDTETTGLLEYKKRHRDPAQPALVQLAAALYQTPIGKDAWERTGVLYGVCEIGDKAIHPKALETHGITAEYCERYGMNAEDMMYVLLNMLHMADVHVAHNIMFDTKVIKSNLYKHGELVESVDEVFPESKSYCTMLKSTALVRAPKKSGRGIKWPTLEECTQHFFGESVGNAHDALADVDACARVYFELRRRGL